MIFIIGSSLKLKQFYLGYYASECVHQREDEARSIVVSPVVSAIDIHFHERKKIFGVS